ncbi:WD repeat-containing protein jip5 [Physocladia obscura]|uniref:WD repeat-containing protein jip5 n=1 Tax=Physocladia obscura TaxID=109957 RepID=A0AAD5XD26_9FUNG|nr:WD repeat-containing protein jip5 [Physocladia obscura]
MFLTKIFKRKEETAEPETIVRTEKGTTYKVVKGSAIYTKNSDKTVTNQFCTNLNEALKDNRIIDGRPSGDYIAISHVWGQNVIETRRAGWARPVLSNSVTKLNIIESVASSRNVWCDVYSIDQKDKSDIAAQVAIMGKIYREAAATVVILSEKDSKKIVQTVRMLKVLISCLRDMEDGVPRPEVKSVILWLWGQDMTFVLEDYDSRVWTLQEKILSRQINYITVVPCNNGESIPEEFRHSDVADLLRISRSRKGAELLRGFWSNKHVEDFHDGLERIAETLCAKMFPSVLREIDGISDVEALRLARTSSLRTCSVDRDNLFGLYGICKQVNPYHYFEFSENEVAAMTADLIVIGALLPGRNGSTEQSPTLSWCPSPKDIIATGFKRTALTTKLGIVEGKSGLRRYKLGVFLYDAEIGNECKLRIAINDGSCCTFNVVNSNIDTTSVAISQPNNSDEPILISRSWLPMRTLSLIEALTTQSDIQVQSNTQSAINSGNYSVLVDVIREITYIQGRAGMYVRVLIGPSSILPSIFKVSNQTWISFNMDMDVLHGAYDHVMTVNINEFSNEEWDIKKPCEILSKYCYAFKPIDYECVGVSDQVTQVILK